MSTDLLPRANSLSSRLRPHETIRCVTGLVCHTPPLVWSPGALFPVAPGTAGAQEDRFFLELTCQCRHRRLPTCSFDPNQRSHLLTHDCRILTETRTQVRAGRFALGGWGRSPGALPRHAQPLGDVEQPPPGEPGERLGLATDALPTAVVPAHVAVPLAAGGMGAAGAQRLYGRLRVIDVGNAGALGGAVAA